MRPEISSVLAGVRLRCPSSRSALAAQFSSNAAINALLLAADALIYFAVLAGLFRARHRIGIGAFFCALGVMHFLETYLASILYVALPFGIVASPGSTVLFTGKLMLLLLVYIREDAVVVRQPIYGLLIGNLLLFALAFLTRQHGAETLAANRHADFAFLDEMGALMVWGTLILFADCIMMILLYERSRAFLGGRVLARLALTGALVLSFDQVAFYAGLRYLTGAPLAVLFGGWIAKMAAVAIYSVLGGFYLRYVELPRKRSKRPPRLIDVFDLLTYRERYEDLLARTGRDALTGALDRGRLEHLGRKRVEEAALGRPAVESPDHRHRPLQELQRPLRPCRRRHRAAADRAHHQRDGSAQRRRVPLRRRGIHRHRRRPHPRRGAGARRTHPPRCRKPHGSRRAARHRQHRACHLRRRRLRL